MRQWSASDTFQTLNGSEYIWIYGIHADKWATLKAAHMPHYLENVTCIIQMTSDIWWINSRVPFERHQADLIWPGAFARRHSYHNKFNLIFARNISRTMNECLFICKIGISDILNNVRRLWIVCRCMLCGEDTHYQRWLKKWFLIHSKWLFAIKAPPTKYGVDVCIMPIAYETYTQHWTLYDRQWKHFSSSPCALKHIEVECLAVHLLGMPPWRGDANSFKKTHTHNSKSGQSIRNGSKWAGYTDGNRWLNGWWTGKKV